ncbi:MAG: SNF2-related protein [Candidatus Dormibacteria bacterium]
MQKRLLETQPPTGTQAEDRALALQSGGWAAPLEDFQARDLGTLLGLSHGADFSVPGAGKTRVALASYHVRREAGEVSQLLVVSPKSAFESWLDEIDLCFPASRFRLPIVTGPNLPTSDALIVNYERLPELWTALLSWMRADRTLMVLDEAHRMKLGSLGAWGSACLALAPYASRRLILTGTPAPNGVVDLQNLMAFVWPGLGRAAVARATANRDLASAGKMLRPLFVRTTKKELNLPPLDIKLRHLELPPLHRELYDALLGQAARSLRSGHQDLAALGRFVLYLIMAATTPALLATGGSRYEPLAYRVPPLRAPIDSPLSSLMRDLPSYELAPKYVEAAKIAVDNADRGKKTIVWSTFVRNLTSLRPLISRLQPAVVHGTSETPAEDLYRFRTDPRCMVLLTNPASMGEGVSLHQTCHDAIYVDRDFAAGRFLQSLDRIHRLGLAPETETHVTVLVSRGTIDELIETRLATKLQFLAGVLDDPAVRELGDLEEEPTETVGMDAEDVDSLISYLTDSAPT